METEAGFSGLSRSRGPGAVGLMQDFLNTTDIESETDLVDTPGSLVEWLPGRGRVGAGGVLAPGAACSPAEHARVLGLRERLRDALEAVTHGASSDSAFARLDEIAGGGPPRERLCRAPPLRP